MLSQLCDVDQIHGWDLFGLRGHSLVFWRKLQTAFIGLRIRR